MYRENKVLVQNLVKIAQGSDLKVFSTEKNKDYIQNYKKKSLNFLKKRATDEKINAENHKMVMRILRTKASPHLVKNRLDGQFHSNIKVRNNLTIGK